jgi:hypothetical protein
MDTKKGRFGHLFRGEMTDTKDLPQYILTEPLKTYSYSIKIFGEEGAHKK